MSLIPELGAVTVRHIFVWSVVKIERGAGVKEQSGNSPHLSFTSSYMNKLCCEINPHIHCQMCGTKWCIGCFPSEREQTHVMNHLVGAYPKNIDEYNRPRLFWFCPGPQKILLLTFNVLCKDTKLQNRPKQFEQFLDTPSQERTSLDTKENV